MLLAGDLTTLDDPGKEKYPGKKFGDEFPLAWRHQFDGGREWYTALGHKPEHYSDPQVHPAHPGRHPVGDGRKQMSHKRTRRSKWTVQRLVSRLPQLLD